MSEKIRNTFQRRDFLGSQYSASEINGELDEIYKILNSLSFFSEHRTNVDYTVSIYDRAISCLRPGLNITLAALRPQQDGLTLTIKDKSLQAATSNITIFPPPGSGALIEGQTSYTISTNGGFVTLEYDANDGNYYKIG